MGAPIYIEKGLVMARANGRKRKAMREKQERIRLENEARLYRYHKGVDTLGHNVNAHTRLYSGENGSRAYVGCPSLVRESHIKHTVKRFTKTK